MNRQVLGAKGGAGSSFVTKPDTLRSDDSFEILLGLGSGRWKGLTEGLGSLKINGVPMENDDGTSNFEDVQAIFADGNPLEDQIVRFKLGGGGNTQSINTQIANPNSGSPGPWVSGSISTPNADFIDLRFVVQQLFYQDEESLRENTANIEIQMRPSGSPDWVNPFIATTSNTTTYDQSGYDYAEGGVDYRVYLSRSMFNPSGTGFVASTNTNLQVKGKTSSPFVKEIRIEVPNTGDYANKTWEVRARLVEKDSVDADPIQERRVIAFESITAIIKETLGDHPDWDGLVWMQIIGKASDQFNGFPEITGVFDTKICKTPPTSVWDADTREYTGATWDGSYEEHFTTDPAWQLKEFIEDPIHGVAALYPGATLDKWDALEASQYFSELVDDGKGGTHPRFNMNLTLTEAKDIEEMIGYLAGSVNSYAADVGGGVWRLKVDKPETPKMIFTQDNIFGNFNYSHTDVDTRFNDWRGTFLNEELDYETDTVRVFDQDDIDDNGIRFTEIALIGCTNRQEALRRLMFRLRVSLNEYKIVNFTTNRTGRYLSPLDTILVSDGSLNADYLVKSTSRVASNTTDQIELLRPVRLEVGVSYTIHLVTQDQETISRTVTNSATQRGDVTTIYVSGDDLPSNILAESAVSLEADSLPSNPISYRIISIERDEESEDMYSITASIIDSGKWNAMDNVSEDELDDQDSTVEIDPPTVPTDGMFNVVTYSTQFQNKRFLQVNWDRPGSLFFDSYRVDYRINDGPWKLLADNLKDSYIELESPLDGIYDFKIIAKDRRGVHSNALIGRHTLDGNRDYSPPVHYRGNLADLPASGAYEGVRYTVVDQPKVYTLVWEDSSWVEESSYGMTADEEDELDTASIGAGYAIEGLNPDGTVASDKVLTDSISTDAVTTKASAYTAGTIGIPGSWSYIDAQSITITTNGEPIILIYSLSFNCTDNAKARHGLRRDGSDLFLLPEINVSGGDNPSVCFMYQDQPPAGTYTYKIRVGSNDAFDISAAHRSMVALEVKR